MDPRLRRLALLRIAVGLLFLVRTTPLYAAARSLPHPWPPLLGWPEDGWTVRWLDLPPPLLKGLCVVRTLAGATFLLGIRPRFSAAVAVVAAYLVLADDALAYVNTFHLLFASVWVIGVGDCAALLAIRPEPPRATAASVSLVRAWVLSVYFFSALAKCNVDWWSGHTLRLLAEEGALGPLLHDRALAPNVAAPFARAVLLFELLIGPLLLWDRTRRKAIAMAVLFHIGLELTVRPDVFGFTMAALLVAFADGDKPSSARPGAPSAQTPAHHEQRARANDG